MQVWWTKLGKYYRKTSDSPAYAAAVVLYPLNKMNGKKWRIAGTQSGFLLQGA
jgi:hypothetical protein